MNSVLLVDDDVELTRLMVEYLETEGFVAQTVSDGLQAVPAVRSGRYQAVVLDIMMPEQDGLETLREIRSFSNIPIIMLTAKGDDLERILGLEMGADDYLAKPCVPRELVARLRAILRRTTCHSVTSNITLGGLMLSSASRIAELDGDPLTLTSTEFSVLEMLVTDAGMPVSKSQLSETVLEKKLGRYDRSLDMHISKLRRKLGETGSRILTVRGFGYQYAVLPGEQAHAT